MADCSHCGKDGHSSLSCFSKPRKAMKGSSLRTHGKKARKWAKKRSEFLEGKQTHEGYYVCEDCGGWFKNIEVDHIIKRSVRPDLVFEDSNLQALCSACHREKDA